MTHLAVFLLSTLGFAALALAMERHQEDLFGHALAATTTRWLRLAGVAALLLALGVTVRAQGWGVGLVSFSGHTSLGAGLVFGVLVVIERTRPRRTARR
ncbi:DUF3325 domain-containing protein [Variovorax arabinosiphilus]|uniref:DUF3325 domain-containing protein n=1 Tax=Variovorax arabinosiphilus TaxID=3053498 RepID=UPI002577DCA1|nr:MULTISPECIES: DUF3325 domain-containing protein [unclassified Variovorax]MDM0120618.1 DUF3325 domain-containing protein [Variovorax sp. J2L1-78]MDM0127470.1 DUF3325 domain-containing protein [Variovorax sp. J2L1-63]MDM0231169.1 DUF3325 domain-containing protein [Variovorax sp. J2R1-6]